MYFGTKTDEHSITMLYRVVNSEYFPTYLTEYVMLIVTEVDEWNDDTYFSST